MFVSVGSQVAWLPGRREIAYPRWVIGAVIRAQLALAWARPLVAVTLVLLLLLTVARAPASAEAHDSEVSVRLVPAMGACPAASRPCFAEAAVLVRNRSRRPLLVESIEVMSGSVRGVARPVDPPARVAPGAEYSSTLTFEVHVEAVHRVRLGLRTERGAAHTVDVSVGPDPALREAAAARCIHCGANRAGDACRCATNDARRRCSDGAECQGACLFERFDEELPPACRERPGVRCPIPVRTGVRIGHCSEWRAPIGCVAVVPRRDPAGRAEPLPAAKEVQCFE